MCNINYYSPRIKRNGTPHPLTVIDLRCFRLVVHLNKGVPFCLQRLCPIPFYTGYNSGYNKRENDLDEMKN